MGRTSIGKRWAIVHSWERLQSVTAVMAEQNSCESVVRKWVARHAATGDVLDAPRSGRKPAMHATTQGVALELLMGGEFSGAAAVARHLVETQATTRLLSRTTIIRNAKKEAARQGFQLRALVGKPKKMLTAATMKKRMLFAMGQLARDWRCVMFTDRKRFNFRNPGVKVHPVSWVRDGQRRESCGVNHPSGVNVYAGVTPFGMTAFHVVAGTTGYKSAYTNQKGTQSRNITAAQYKDVLSQTLLPEGRRIFLSQGMTSWVLQQDNDPTHKVAGDVVKQFNKKNQTNISVLPGWPPSSPDLSLIESVWAYLDAKMDSLGCKDFTEYKAALAREFKAVSKEYCQRLYAGMPKRLQVCMDREGDKTGH